MTFKVFILHDSLMLRVYTLSVFDSHGADRRTDERNL